MIDLHAHILFGLDDGAKTEEETLEMLQIAEKEGITTMAATPHYIHGANAYDAAAYQQQLEETRQLIKDHHLSIQLLSGNEIYLDEYSCQSLKEGLAHPISDSNYVLVEFSMLAIPEGAENYIDGLRHKGYTPIIAHPERYPEVQEDPWNLRPFLQQGCLLQLNSHSITGLFGRKVQKTATQLINSQMAHLVASDSHSSRNRAPRMKEAFHQISKQTNRQTAQKLFMNNPKAIINNQPVNNSNPVENINSAGNAAETEGVWTQIRRLASTGS